MTKRVYYHPAADRTRDSIVRAGECITRLERIQITAESSARMARTCHSCRQRNSFWGSSKAEPSSRRTTKAASGVAIARVATSALDQIRQGDRASTVFVEAVRKIENTVPSHKVSVAGKAGMRRRPLERAVDDAVHLKAVIQKDG